MEEKTDEELAELFHNEYEKTAKAYGWHTQKECKIDFWDLPESNRKTMISTVIQVRKVFEDEARKKVADEIEKLKDEIKDLKVELSEA